MTNAALHWYKICRIAIAACVTAVGIVLGIAAEAQTQRNLICNLNTKPTEDMIRVCTERIQSGHDTGRSAADSYISRGRAYMAKNQYDRAIADFSEAVKNAPGYVLALRSRANAYLLNAAYDRAITDYTDAIWLAPRDSALFHERARAYEGKGQYERAILDYSDVIRISPRLVAAYKDRCYVRTIWGRELPQALGDCNDALKLAPRDLEVFERRGLVYLRLALYDKAIEDFDAVLRVKSLQAAALYGRGLAKRKKLDQTGDADVNAAQLLRPDIVEQYARYGIK